MSGKRLLLHMLGALVLALTVVACARQPPEEAPSPAATTERVATPTQGLTLTALPTVTQTSAVFRSDQYHLTVDLPPGWAAAEGPQLLAKPYEGLVALNSWGEPGFWATWIETKSATGTSHRYDRDAVLSQIPDGGAYVVLIQVEGPGGVQAEAYGPEYERQDLSGVVLRSGSEFFKWGCRLRLEVYRHPNASAGTSVELDALLASWHFDRVPVGDPSWAILEALWLLPPEVHPLAFPLRDGRRVWQGNVVRSVQTEVVGGTVLVTFTYRWDAPTTGGLADDCPPGRCYWWRFEARPSGEVVLVEEGGAEPPTPTPAPQVRGIYTPEDMQWQYDEWPDDCKFAIDEEVAVRFAFPDPMIDWIGPVFINHIPSLSAVTLDYGGEITYEHYGSEDGRARLQAALGDPALMARIRNRVDEIWGDAQPGYADLLEALRERGATVEPGSGVSDPFFSVEGRMMVVNGAEVGAFEYPGPATAAFEAGRISPDGNMVKRAEDQASHAFWVAPPHFYRQGKLIVLYVGDDQAVTGVLEAVLGEPFAGG